MLRSTLCYYSDIYILAKGTITVAEVAAGRGNNVVEVVFKNCAPLTNCMGETNNTQIDNAKCINKVMSMYSLINYSHNYSKPSGSLWKYYTQESTLNNTGAPVDFPGNSASIKFKQKIIGSTGYDETKAIQRMVQLKYLSNFWRTLEMLLINQETNLILTWSANCVISNAAVNQATTFPITHTELYAPVVT